PSRKCSTATVDMAAKRKPRVSQPSADEQSPESAAMVLPSGGWLGIDIGGANLKVSDGDQFACSEPFALWQQPQRLASAIAKLLDRSPPFRQLAVTMTGELCDCFLTREEGVCRILEQLTLVVPSPWVRVYGVGGKWYSVPQAARNPWSVAASNWDALARYVASLFPEVQGLLVDIGSTTTDLIPLGDGKPQTTASTDSQRLQERQLVYCGVQRTPIASLVDVLPLHGTDCPVMAESFATTEDVYLWKGWLEEDEEDCDTSDRRPKTKEHAGYRLARMVGEDGASLAPSDLDAIADAIIDAQAGRIAEAMDRQRRGLGARSCETLFLAGHAPFLMDQVLRKIAWKPSLVDLEQLWGAKQSRCAPSLAVCRLAIQSSELST
ncbi:MAG: hydantoinase/oxoprolinase family protein, partial [Pirellulaceae bacterium]